MVTVTAEPTFMTKSKKKNYPPRILLAKIGLDGHDRGVKVLARSFRDAGIEVIYTGLWQTCEATMYAALQEDVDVVGVSLLSAAHLTVMPELLKLRKHLDIEHIPMILGGIVPVEDHASLTDMGVAAVFNPGSSVDDIVHTVKQLAAAHEPVQIDDIFEGYKQRKQDALAKMITIVQRGGSLNGITPPVGDAVIIGVTGAPGVGKSSFIGKLGEVLVSRGKRVAVLAIDPSSPITGGALLGDRLRMMSASPESNFFVRSLASGGVAGGLAATCPDVLKLLVGFGFDYILVETVGAGQGDVGIRELAKHTLLVLMPDSGDAVQFSKAGIMEIATCFVLNKCDLKGADTTHAQMMSALGETRPIFKTSTLKNEGINSVADFIVTLS